MGFLYNRKSLSRLREGGLRGFFFLTASHHRGYIRNYIPHPWWDACKCTHLIDRQLAILRRVTAIFGFSFGASHAWKAICVRCIVSRHLKRKDFYGCTHYARYPAGSTSREPCAHHDSPKFNIYAGEHYRCSYFGIKTTHWCLILRQIYLIPPWAVMDITVCNGSRATLYYVRRLNFPSSSDSQSRPVFHAW